jgi:tetratricopeptide (TPR) repeat protein
MKGQYDEAIADFNKVIELDPKDKDTFISRGMAYAENGQYDHAIADLDQVLKLDPECALAIENRAKITAKKIELIRKASTEAPMPIKLITAEDEEKYGAELIDLAKRAAKEAMAAELNMLKQENASLKSQIGQIASAFEDASKGTH